MSEADDRAAYLDWLRREVETYCNADGCYELYWDYRDSLSPDQILEAYKKYKEEGFESPLGYLESQIELEGDPLYGILLDDLGSASEEVNLGWYDAVDVRSDLESVGYNGVDTNIEQLLNQSSFRVNVFFATEPEMNYDFSSIVDSFGNDYRDFDPDSIEADRLDNALSYLVNQQGHSVSEVYSALEKGESDNAFIKSVQEEITENSSEAMSEVAALVRMDGQQLLDFLEKRDAGHGTLVLPKDYATIGIFNEWSGCGGMLDIQPEKDVVMPLSMAWNFNIEGQRSHSNGYTVDDVYGLVGEAWSPNFSISDAPAPQVKEDYEKVIEQVRKQEHQIENAPVSLADRANEAKEVSAEISDSLDAVERSNTDRDL